MGVFLNEVDSIGVSQGVAQSVFATHRRPLLAAILFSLLFFGVLIYILWGFISSIMGRFFPSSFGRRPDNHPGGSSWWPWGGGGPGAPPGGPPGPPPPYAKNVNEPAAHDGMGFWTGLGLGGVGAYLAANAANRRREAAAYDPGRRYGAVQDRRWEAFRRGEDIYDDGRGFPRGGRGQAGSDLGEIRRATGFGGTNVR